MTISKAFRRELRLAVEASDPADELHIQATSLGSLLDMADALDSLADRAADPPRFAGNLAEVDKRKAEETKPGEVALRPARKPEEIAESIVGVFAQVRLLITSTGGESALAKIREDVRSAIASAIKAERLRLSGGSKYEKGALVEVQIEPRTTVTLWHPVKAKVDVGAILDLCDDADLISQIEFRGLKIQQEEDT